MVSINELETDLDMDNSAMGSGAVKPTCDECELRCVMVRRSHIRLCPGGILIVYTSRSLTVSNWERYEKALASALPGADLMILDVTSAMTIPSLMVRTHRRHSSFVTTMM